MRDNERRFGADTGAAAQPTAAIAAQAEAPLAQSQGLSFVVPTEFVELPSKGRFYPKEHPLHNKEVIEIKHMTAKEEDILTKLFLYNIPFSDGISFSIRTCCPTSKVLPL